MLPTLTVLPGVTLVLVDLPILTPSSNSALRGATLEVVGGTTLNNITYIQSWIRVSGLVSGWFWITVDNFFVDWVTCRSVGCTSSSADTSNSQVAKYRLVSVLLQYLLYLFCIIACSVIL